MDGRSFDDLTRRLVGRRTFLGGLAGLAAGLLGGGTAGAACPPEQVHRQRMGCVCQTTGRPPNGGGCPCPTGKTRCGAGCVVLAKDASNCGACGNACTANERCMGGACVCVPDCEGKVCGEDGCGGSCGGCDTAQCLTCDAVTHSCVPTCVSDSPCVTATCANGSCDRIAASEGASCGSGVTCCGGACVDTAFDSNNCGVCGNVCGGDDLCETALCSGGSCAPAVRFCPDCQRLVAPCDPSVGPQCEEMCAPPADLCHLPATDCFLNGGCVYPEKPCGPCETCDPATGDCISTCGLCEICSQSGECVSTCPTAQPCQTVTCEVGRGCVTTTRSDACCSFVNAPNPNPQNTSCGANGEVCDGAGNCVCAIECGTGCCPFGTVDCCVDTFSGSGDCCATACVAVALTNVCPV